MRVRMENIHKSFGHVEVVKGLDLDVEDGEFLVLLGASGSGKTTALRMIAGLESVTSGRVLIGERDVTHMLPKYRDVAMVFQSYALYPHMTVFANIAYPLTVRKLPKPEIEAAVREVARQVQLDQLLDRYPRQLSGGQRQRVALARAMIRRPAAFLMDEPLSNLDAKLRGYMRAELKHMQHQLGITTIYVTHDQIEAMTLAHRVALLEKGVLQQLDTPANIYNRPANLFVAGFIGSPPMNLIACVAETGDSVRIGTHLIPTFQHGQQAGTRLVLGIRPEDVTTGEGDFTLDVEFSEELGVARHYHGQLAGEVFVVQVAGARGGVPAQIPYSLPPSALHLFDAQSGKRLPTR
jgi:multiple sugar transport system ATP-binding protein